MDMDMDMGMATWILDRVSTRTFTSRIEYSDIRACNLAYNACMWA